MAEPINIVLITGFLGSGKTTLLQNIHHHNPDKKLVFLVNDFSAADIDGQILSEEKDDIISIAGGSIFCQCKVTDFVNQLNAIPPKYPDTETVVIEASGVANPSVIQKMLIETKLINQYIIKAIIAVADPVTLPVLVQTLPNIKAQIQMADHVILNKTDLCSSEEVDRTEKIIHDLNNQAQFFRTKFCKLPINILDLNRETQVPQSQKSSHTPQTEFTSISFRKKAPVSIEKLNTLISQFPHDLYRIKGFIITNEGQTKSLNYTGKSLVLANTDRKDLIQLEFIFNSEYRDKIVAQIRRLAD